ncbi:hypothetical protein [Pelagicoccus sp. SDUM812005]|uniref:hypothetical protein n=1 Tax=Pelagicoccus sp. SDUM812005 TaxID=3041257 RepID=UPI0028106BCA|nr:hypothetical protein [Pelagicoccus sp. SDUM812005]MDQ8181693.1 hypothetical protein [Pelagicoccus sp. SDUM812005]
MKKVYLVYVAIAVIAILGNWRIEEQEKDLSEGSSLNVVNVTSFFEISSMILIAAIIVVVVLRKLQKARGRRKVSYLPILLLIPILVSVPKYTTHREVWVEEGILKTWNFQFPVENNLLLFGLASILMILIQRLTKENPEAVGARSTG